MDELIAFMKARLDEDERYLKANRRHLWTERPLREVAAKRAIVGWHPPELMQDIDAARVFRCPPCELTWPCPTIRVIAAVWNEHDDYRQEWKP